MADILKSIRNGGHNHTPTLASAHSALRRLAMTEEVRESISSLTKAEVEVSHGQRGGGQRGGGQRGERAATPPSIQTDAGLFAAFHM